MSYIKRKVKTYNGPEHRMRTMFNNQPIRPVPITGEAVSNTDRNTNKKQEPYQQ